MGEACLQTVELYHRLALVPPNHLARILQPLLVVGHRDEVLERRHGALWPEEDTVRLLSGSGWNARRGTRSCVAIAVCIAQRECGQDACPLASHVVGRLTFQRKKRQYCALFGWREGQEDEL